MVFCLVLLAWWVLFLLAEHFVADSAVNLAEHRPKPCRRCSPPKPLPQDRACAQERAAPMHERASRDPAGASQASGARRRPGRAGAIAGTLSPPRSIQFRGGPVLERASRDPAGASQASGARGRPGRAGAIAGTLSPSRSIQFRGGPVPLDVWKRTARRRAIRGCSHAHELIGYISAHARRETRWHARGQIARSGSASQN